MKGIAELNHELELGRKKVASIQDKINAIKEQQALPELRKKYVGRYFVFQNSDGSRQWSLYRKILDISDVWFIGDDYSLVRVCLFEFQSHASGMSDGETIFSVGRDSIFSLEYVGREISKKEFDTAWNAFVEKLKSMRDD